MPSAGKRGGGEEGGNWQGKRAIGKGRIRIIREVAK
jgi:hypothetical protein